MNYFVLTLFPEMIENALSVGVVGQALKDGVISLKCLSPRAFTENVHQTVDDRPFGGGDGMVMLTEPMAMAFASLTAGVSKENSTTIHVSPRGRRLDDGKLRKLAEHRDIVFVSSRYGGLDQRFINRYVDEEISIGDYVLSGGELAVLVMIDAISRLLPGVLGNEASSLDESFAPGFSLLEQPQFTRPRMWREAGVPDALLSGHHEQIAKWKRMLSILVTAEMRPDLLFNVPAEELMQAARTLSQMSEPEFKLCGLKLRERVVQNLKSARRVITGDQAERK